MSKSKMFDRFKRLVAISKYAEENNLTSQEAIDRVLEQEEKARQSRRDFMKQSGMGLAALTFGNVLSPKAFSALTTNVGIVGAGLAGLTTAYELKKAGVIASLYEASNRVGGRQHSLRNFFPGQVAENGGELIDTLHTTIRGYAKEFGLELEDLSKSPGELKYYFKGALHNESVVVDQFRVFVAAMKDDLNNLSGEVTAASFTEYDRKMDLISLEEYLNGANSKGLVMGPIAKEAVRQSYIAEYGIEPSELSVLGFLFFIHSDRRSKFKPYGVFSTERFHVKNGNDLIAQNIASRLPAQIKMNMTLVKVAKTSAGKIELSFKQGTKTIVHTHDAVVLTLPFSVLRNIEMHSSLGLPATKINAINNLGYGDNAKMMVGFNGRPWFEKHNGNGSVYADLPNLQTTWETNPVFASSTQGIITDYSGATRGKNLDPRQVQGIADKFLTDFNLVFPGSKDVARKNASKNYVVHLEHWPSNPLAKGSYTAYKKGQFTTICGEEGKAVGNLYFAGEHTDSFYSWQGFMEGACLSGIKAAADILAKR
jgi:monoamine oxidase